MKRIVCSICGSEVDEDVWEYHRSLEERILSIIRRYNPAWILPDGSCPKAVEFFRTFVLGNEGLRRLEGEEDAS